MCFRLPSRTVIQKIIRGKQQELVLNKLTKNISNESKRTPIPRAHRPPARRTSQKKKKRGETEKIRLLTDFCLPGTMKMLSLCMLMYKVLVLPPPLAMPGTVNVKPQSPAPCAWRTRWGSWSGFFPFLLYVSHLFSAHSKCWPLTPASGSNTCRKWINLCKNTTFFLGQFPKERSCKQSSCLYVCLCLTVSSSWVTHIFTKGISTKFGISTKVDRSLQDIS